MTPASDLQRFVSAQQPVYETVVGELRAGLKRSHWMWFVFPQLAGLGHSEMARRYALRSLSEARAYLAHPLLGPRIRQCTGLVNTVTGRDVGPIFGTPDDLKFRSSMTLFHRADMKEPLFTAALAKYFGGREDRRTLDLLAGGEDDGS